MTADPEPLVSTPPRLGVSVVVSTRGRRGLAWGDRRRSAVEALRALSTAAGASEVEVVVVHDDEVADDVLAAIAGVLARPPRFLRVRADQDEPERLNLGVLASSREMVVLLDEHTETVAVNFLAALTAPLLAGAGLTGPRVLRTDGRLADAGLAFHGRRIVGMFEGWPADVAGPDGLLKTTRRCAGLNSACLALPRATFDDVGGLCEKFPLLWHVDLARKVTRAERDVVWVAGATTYQVSRVHPDPRQRTKEMIALRARWASTVQDALVPLYGPPPAVPQRPSSDRDLSAG